MSEPVFKEVDLTVLQDEGVLMAINEKALWPLGLALTWYHAEDGMASGLHVREWVYPDGHHESIEDDGSDPTPERRRRFRDWLAARAASMTVGHEADDARATYPEVD